MKVTRVLPLILLLSFISYAQIPIGYYTSAENNADNDLKYALNQIIDNHTEFPYTSSSTDVWDILKQTDKDPNNSSNVILIEMNSSRLCLGVSVEIVIPVKTGI